MSWQILFEDLKCDLIFQLWHVFVSLFPANGTIYFNYVAKIPFLSSIKRLLKPIREQLDLINFLLLCIAVF